jgi:NtrC-family two-component system sensor histidine kinase KinB
LFAAKEEVQRLNALVRNLLDLSRIEAGKIEMQIERTPVPLLFDKIRAVFAAQAQTQSVELSAEVETGLPQVLADPTKITWVLSNLVSNALRYTRAGGRIRLKGERVGSQVHVSVVDDGAGIPPEYQSRVFEKFVRVAGDASPGGSGLGLAICKEMIRAHRGSIWVESEPGAGSTFTFTLPVA